MRVAGADAQGALEPALLPSGGAHGPGVGGSYEFGWGTAEVGGGVGAEGAFCVGAEVVDFEAEGSQRLSNGTAVAAKGRGGVEACVCSGGAEDGHGVDLLAVDDEHVALRRARGVSTDELVPPGLAPFGDGSEHVTFTKPAGEVGRARWSW